MAEALKYAAPYAGALGVSVDDTALAMGLMGNNAIRSGMAGRTLRNVFSRLANDTNDALTTLQGLGVEVFDDTGKFRDFSDIIMDSREAWAGMTDQQKITNATIVAGTQGSSGWLSIMNATDDKVKDLTESIQGATGAAQEMADTRIGTNLAGDLTILGRRDNIRVIREEGGVQKTYLIDLRSMENLVQSPAYYICQNDLIYVEPNEMRTRQSTVNGNTVLSTSFWISIASLAATIVSTITVVAMRTAAMNN